MSREFITPDGLVSSVPDGRDFVLPAGFLVGEPVPPEPPVEGEEGLAKVWTGSAWAKKPAKVWTGSAWVAKPVKFWTGSAWVPTAGTAVEEWGSEESLYPVSVSPIGWSDASVYSLGSRIVVLTDGRITGIRYWRTGGNSTSRSVCLWSDAGALLFSAVTSGETDGWNVHPVSPPLAVSAGQAIRVTYGYGGSAVDPNLAYTPEAITVDTVNLDWTGGCFTATGTANFPDGSNANHYFADIVYQESL